MPRRHHDQKGKRQWVEADEEDTVDDLAHAATFAMMTLIPNPINVLDLHCGGTMPVSHSGQAMASVQETQETNRDHDDIELDESSTDDKDIDDNKVEECNGNDQSGEKAKEGEEEEEDDDQSEVDLAEELAKMEDDEALDDDEDNGNEDGDNNNRGNKIPRPPKTENELDAYRTPIHELEKHLQFQLTVTPDESGGVTTQHRRLTASDFQLAGRIKHYMAMDRTVVVESSVENPHGEMSSFKHHNAPLDEGTLLFVRFLNEGQNGSTTDQELTPLGRIFEIFGPVSKPLYTIRLPTKPIMKSRSRSSNPTVAYTEETCKSDITPSQTVKEGNEIKSSQKVEERGVESEPTTTQNNGRATEDLLISTQVQPDQDDTNEEGTTISYPVEKSANATTSDSTDEASIPRENTIDTQEEEDDWASEGKYAKLLQQHTLTAVYYVKDEAKLIDTGSILKLSGKGCDASNLYDEEVVNTSDMYYSDDEEERQAKNRRKSKVSQHQEATISRKPTANNQNTLPSGFHHATSPSNQRFSPFHQKMPLPPGFHPAQPPPPPGRRHDVSTPIYPVVPRGVRGPLPPPPPASGGMNPPPAYQY